MSGAADGEAVDLEGRDADADGDGLAVFAAGAYAFVEFEIVADHAYARQNVGAVADQGRILHRRRNLAVLDEVRFGGREDEFAVGNVDLAAAEVHGVEAALHRAQDVLGRIFAAEHVGVRHARHGNVLVAFASAVAGVAHVHETRGVLVGQV